VLRKEDEHPAFLHWNETHSSDRLPREIYRTLIERLDNLPKSRIKALDERLEATMREMGVTFDISRDRAWGMRPWICDLLPQVFAAEEWSLVGKGLAQRMKAFELFLRDIYGDREILRSGTLPVQPVLGSPFYQHAASGLPLPGGAFLHLSGASLCRLPDGRMAFKHHYFSNASGISYMMQNRRALARVLPQSFGNLPIASIAEVPTAILENLHALSGGGEPRAVLLSPGSGSAVYSEHAFLARRMGIPLVQGGDLLVLNDALYLKTVSGLEKVDIIYSRVSDPWLDPMVFRRDSLLGVSGLVHCIRRGSVVLVNAIGSQLADDRALLPFSTTIIRFYLGERPVLPGLPTYWLGDIDQRELVLADISSYTIRPLYGERIVLGGDGQLPTEKACEEARREILQNASGYVAQPQGCDATTITYHDGRRKERRQDHIVFALRGADGNPEVFESALTRTSTESSPYTSNELGGGSKDTWVEDTADHSPQDRQPVREVALPSQHVGSRVAEAFYWVGRYLERANSLAGMIRVIETLELEELNPTERTLYRPVWNKILPPLENPGGVTRRNISSPAGRHRLALDLKEPDSVAQTVIKAARNAESILECLSLEAWGVLASLRGNFSKVRFRPKAAESEITSATRKVCDDVSSRVPEFFGMAEATMLADGGWAFCEIGQLIERAIITANALQSILKKSGARAGEESEHEEEIRLSAFLRLLNSRDIYRRVYQMRIEEVPLLELLWQNPDAPRSVTRCLQGCINRLQQTRDINSPATRRTLGGIENLLEDTMQTHWQGLLDAGGEGARTRGSELLKRTLDLHHLISDGFLNHQVFIHSEIQPNLFGPKNAV
jgi:uncharacterized circularly permuted ATP-grasp superfamily protein/uncharacterized alpha-E superfamily protein